jgi:hypothetical protein
MKEARILRKMGTVVAPVPDRKKWLCTEGGLLLVSRLLNPDERKINGMSGCSYLTLKFGFV